MGKFGLYCPSICGRVQQLTLSPQQPPEEEALTVEAVYPWVTDILDDRTKGHTGINWANCASLRGVRYRIEGFASGDGLAVSVKVWCVSSGESTCRYS